MEPGFLPGHGDGGSPPRSPDGEATGSRHPVLDGVNAVAVQRLRFGGTLRRLRDGEVLWRRGGHPVGLVLLLEGEVRVVRGDGGRQQAIHVERAGGTLGEVPLFSGHRYPATAISVRDGLCLVVPLAVVEQAIGADPRLALLLLDRLARRVHHIVDRLDTLSSRSVRQRLAAWILSRDGGRDDGAAAGGGGAPALEGGFRLGPSQAWVAEELGTVREVLVRALRALRSEGLIAAAGRGRIRVENRETLERMARGEAV